MVPYIEQINPNLERSAKMLDATSLRFLRRPLPVIRPTQWIDAMAVVYMLMTTVLIVAALFFINSTQIVARVKKVR